MTTKDDAHTHTKTTPFLELATKIDQAIREADTKRKAVEAVQAKAAAATEEYNTAVATLNELLAEAEAFLATIRSQGGTVHAPTA